MVEEDCKHANASKYVYPMFSLSSHGCSFLVLFDDCNFADSTFAAVASSCFYHINTASYFLAILVFTIPRIDTTIASALVYQNAIGCYDFTSESKDKPVMVMRPV